MRDIRMLIAALLLPASGLLLSAFALRMLLRVTDSRRSDRRERP